MNLTRRNLIGSIGLITFSAGCVTTVGSSFYSQNRAESKYISDIAVQLHFTLDGETDVYTIEFNNDVEEKPTHLRFKNDDGIIIKVVEIDDINKVLETSFSEKYRYLELQVLIDREDGLEIVELLDFNMRIGG